MKFDRELYYQMKMDGLLDKEIAKEFGMCKDSLTRYKRLYSVKFNRRTRKNKSGISEKQIQKGIKNGLTRELILKRCRNGFSNERAINTPKM
jgi:hypothetical protein